MLAIGIIGIIVQLRRQSLVWPWAMTMATIITFDTGNNNNQWWQKKIKLVVMIALFINKDINNNNISNNNKKIQLKILQILKYYKV